MSALPGPRLDELFVRYWDGALTPTEAGELERWLAADPAARAGFQFLCAQAVATAELPVLAPVVEPSARVPVAAPRGRSRRWALGAFGGLVAGAGGAALGWWWWDDYSEVRLASVQGRVTVRTADGSTVPAVGSVPAGATVLTQGIGAVAVLTYPGGGTVSLLGDSELTVGHGGRELRLRQGTASADLRADRLTLFTELVTLADLGGTAVTLDQGERSAEVEVHRGRVSVATATGAPLAVVRGGELLTVGANGAHRREPSGPAPSEFAWDLTVPLPAGWHVGRREVGPEGPVVRPVAWPDPYYDGTVMFQIRSDHQWTRGLFSVTDDSVVSVRYRARRACPRGQVCFCVRTSHSNAADTGVLEYNDGFEATGGAWRWLRVPAREMLANKHAPKFGPLRIGFLVIVNTFETDIGLEIAELRVSSSGDR